MIDCVALPNTLKSLETQPWAFTHGVSYTILSGMEPGLLTPPWRMALISNSTIESGWCGRLVEF